MLTRRIDRALDALATCRSRLPGLRDIYRPESVERAALDRLLAALAETETALAQGPCPGAQPASRLRPRG